MMDEALYNNLVDDTNTLHCDQRNYNVNKVRIKNILFDNYDYLVSLDQSGKARPCILDNVQKSLLCATHYLGYDVFTCPVCDNFNFIPHTCHAHFCQKCGIKRSKQLAASIVSFALDVTHRHVVFTIPKELRVYFIKDRTLLNLLFVAARNAMAQLVNKTIFERLKRKADRKFKQMKTDFYTFKDFPDAKRFGMVATLHTFGRSLQWNPHIHAIIPEIIYDPKKDIIKKFNYFDYKKLRKTFQYELLKLLEIKLGDEFKPAKRKCYYDHKEGFYVFAKPMLDSNDDSLPEEDISDNLKACVSYCMRYAGRPPMSEERIVSYDGDKDNGTISWYYIDHETEERVDVNESAHDFINKLIIHCPDPNFKMTRLYGFYSNRSQDTLDRVHELLGNTKKKNRYRRHKIRKHNKDKLKYRTHLIDTFNRDPIKCSCGNYMLFSRSVNPFSKEIDEDGIGGERNDRRYRNDCINEVRQLRIRRQST